VARTSLRPGLACLGHSGRLLGSMPDNEYRRGRWLMVSIGIGKVRAAINAADT
jgi:hypothetical protein